MNFRPIWTIIRVRATKKKKSEKQRQSEAVISGLFQLNGLHQCPACLKAYSKKYFLRKSHTKQCMRRDADVCCCFRTLCKMCRSDAWWTLYYCTYGIFIALIIGLNLHTYLVHKKMSNLGGLLVNIFLLAVTYAQTRSTYKRTQRQRTERMNWRADG